MNMVDVVKTIEGYNELYQHQRDSIMEIENGNGILLVAPTAAGKTVVAKAAMLKAILERKKGVYVSPLVALSSEKYEEFQEFFKKAKNIGIIDKEPNIVFMTGEIHEATKNKDFREADILVTSFEKFDSIITRSETEEFVKNIYSIVIDEIHILYDENRGATVEKFVSIAKHINPNIKFIALSATIGDPELIAKWLDTKLIKTDFRPVRLQKLVYTHKDGILIDAESGDIIDEEKSTYKLPTNFIEKKLQNGKQIIIFVSSRRIAESLAKNLVNMTSKYTNEEEIEKTIDLGKLENDPISEKVRQLITRGVAFHHSGLPPATRRVIENAFRKGVIKIITATPGLSAGVNLPANTVIVRDITRYDGEKSAYLSAFEVQQMIGRAGRPQYDKEGTAIIVTNIKDSASKVAKKYYFSGVESVNSSIARDFKSKYNILETKLAHLVLQFVKAFGTTSPEVIKSAFSNTFASITDPWVIDIVDNVIDELKKEEFISDSGLLPAGEISINSYVVPETITHMRSRIHENMTEEEFVYMIITTPEARSFGNFTVTGNADFDRIFEISEKLNIDPFENTDDILKTMMVLDWLHGKTDIDILNNYGVLPGDFRGYVNTLEWMAWVALNIASTEGVDIGFDETILMRIRYGIPKEAVDLVRIPMIGKIRAMKLYRNGIRTVEDFINASDAKLSEITGLRPETIAQLKMRIRK